MKRIFSSALALASALLLGAAFPMMALAQVIEPGPPGPPGPQGPPGETRWLGLDPNAALIIGISIGAVLFLVVVVAIVAMVKGSGHNDTHVVHTP